MVRVGVRNAQIRTGTSTAMWLPWAKSVVCILTEQWRLDGMRLDLDWYITGVCIGTYAMFFFLGGSAFLRSPAFTFITLLYIGLFLIQLRNNDGERVILPSLFTLGLSFAYLLLL